jgi:hypothetical protein
MYPAPFIRNFLIKKTGVSESTIAIRLTPARDRTPVLVCRGSVGVYESVGNNTVSMT